MISFTARSFVSLLFIHMACWLANAMPTAESPGESGCLQRRQPNTQTVQTLFSGQIVGNKLSNDLYSFLGIPYAEPPTGTNRFAAPISYSASLFQTCTPIYSKLSASINATEYSNICPQASGGAEDCLYLNVFTTSLELLSLRPVMFWIHGGSFVEGTGANPVFNGEYLAQQNVVVVTFNYRLGVLGWLDGGSGFPTVNMGLQDTILALEWVRDNILFFGGNPLSVTIFGESSGSQLIRALMASPKAKGLFNRAILQSDPQYYPIENRTISEGIVGQYALSQIGCTTLECAQAASVATLVAATEATAANCPFMNVDIPVTPLSPTIDGTWVAGDWSALIASNSLPNAVPVIMGTVQNEGTPTVYGISSVPLPSSEYEYIMSLFVGNTRATQIAAEPQFQLNSSDPDTVRNTLSEVATLFFFTCAVQANALAYANQQPVYLYELLLGCTDPDNAADPLCTSNGEVCHEDDLGMVFGTCTSPTSQQTTLSNELMARWAAFATSGNPNIAGSQYLQWQKVGSSTNLNAIRFSANSVVNDTLYSSICGPIFGSTIPFNFELFN